MQLNITLHSNNRTVSNTKITEMVLDYHAFPCSDRRLCNINSLTDRGKMSKLYKVLYLVSLKAMISQSSWIASCLELI